MVNPTDTLNTILSEELDRFFEKKEADLRPWQTDEWNQNREDILADECQWCGETSEPLHIHHTDSGPNWAREWIKATDTAFVNSDSWDPSLGKSREECPNCGFRDYYARKTKTPTYRCNRCEGDNAEFETPRTISAKEAIESDDYQTKPYTSQGYYSAKLSWLQDHRRDARRAFSRRFSDVMDEYVEMVNVVTICQSCHFQEEQTSNQRCTNCGENWHSYNKEMCWDCLVEEKGLVECDCGDGWYQESKYDACSDCR